MRAIGRTEAKKRMITVIITFILQQTFIMSQECPDIYRRYTKDHTGCLQRKSSCEFLKIGMDDPETEKEIILRYHNEIRSKIATGQEKGAGGMPPAANMLELTWDDELAHLAQKWAENCRIPCCEHDCWPCRATRTFTVCQCMSTHPYYCPKDGNCRPRKNDWIASIKLYYDEVSNFDKKLIKKMAWARRWGHFVQVNWAKTYKVGCGVSIYRLNSREVNHFYVCDYGPSPDMSGGVMYLEGPPCSACPINSCCGASTCSHGGYPGLCHLYSTPPQYSHSPNRRFYCAFQTGDSNCAFTQEGDVGWQIFTTVDGNMVSTVLAPGQTASIHLQQWIYATNGSCLYLLMKAGPNVAGQKNAILSRVILDYNGEQFPTFVWSYVTWEFHKFPVVLKKDGYFQVTLSMQVATGDPPQFFECKEIEVVEEPCDFHIKEISSGSQRWEISTLLQSVFCLLTFCCFFS